MVTKVTGDLDLDFDSSSSDGEDQDEIESVFEGHAEIIWRSLEETIEKIDDILVVDRGFWYGDIVACISDPAGQTGTVVNVDLLVDLKTPGGEILRNINSKQLLRVSTFAVGDYVIHGPWLGRVDEVVDNVTVQFDDGAKCKLMRADPEHLIPITCTLLEDAHYPYHPGQRVRGSSSSVFKNVLWLRGAWKASDLEGTVSDVEVGSVYVNWIAAVSPSHGSQVTITPAEQQDPNQLKLLSCFSHANWQLGDWCMPPTYKKSSESASTATEDVLPGIDTSVKADTLLSDSGSAGFGLKDAMHDGRVLHHKEICRGLVKHDKRQQHKEDVPEQALCVVNTKTKVDVVWQDGTRSFCLDSRTLFPVDNLGDHDFWPEQYVLEKGSDEDGVGYNARRVGVVRSVDSKERTVRVKWLKQVEQPENLREFDQEEVVSVYELTEHPDYTYCIGDIVIHLSSIPKASVHFRMANQPGEQKEFLEKVEPENGTGSKESNFSCIGYITGLKDGAVEVAWADGTSSKVGPQAIIVVGRDENEGSSQSSFGEDAEEYRDDSASWEIGDSIGMGVHEQELNEDEEATLNETVTTNDHGITNSNGALHTEGSLHQYNGGALSFPLAVFGFVVRLAIGFLGIRGYITSNTLNSSSYGQSTQECITDGTELDVCHEKTLVRNSQCHQPESAATDTRDALHTINSSVIVLEGKEDIELCSPRYDSECSDCGGEEQMNSFQYSVGDLGELTLFSAVKKQKQGLADDKSGFFKHFDSVKEPTDHYFLTETGQSSNQREWVKKVQQEWTILQKSLPETIYVRVYEDRMDLLRAVIIGAAGTPYHDGLFFFDIHLPTEYPHVPPSVYYHSGGLRLNPNLYENGKICLSLLNTWTGKGNEVWDPTNSSILQVLVSLQGLVLNAKPYFNEAGYDKQIGRAEGEKNSLAYNENSFLLSCKTMLYLIRKPPKHFELFVREYFCNRSQHILGACNEYMKGAQVGCLSEDKGGSQNNSSIGFKIMLAKLIPKLVSAFNEVGANCQQLLQPVYNKEFADMVKKTV